MKTKKKVNRSTTKKVATKTPSKTMTLKSGFMGGKNIDYAKFRKNTKGTINITSRD